MAGRMVPVQIGGVDLLVVPGSKPTSGRLARVAETATDAYDAAGAQEWQILVGGRPDPPSQAERSVSCNWPVYTLLGVVTFGSRGLLACLGSPGGGAASCDLLRPYAW